jgi:hypothetical protein
MRVRPEEVSGYGLVSALPLSVFAGLAVLTLAFLATLAFPRPHRLVLAELLVSTVCCLHGASMLASSLPRFEVTWIHVGFVEYISRTGTVLPTLDARFSWPGFFAVWALWLGGHSWQELVPVLSMVPVLSNLLYLLPLALLLRNLRMSWQARWFAAWLFCVFNWIGQDYFSPQGYTYGLYLLFVAGTVAWLRPRVGVGCTGNGWLRSVLRWLRLPEPAVSGELPPKAISSRLRCMVLLLLIGVFLVATFSHQLTPFIMLAVCAALVLTGRCVCRDLPLLLVTLLAAYISYLAAAYWGGHLSEMVADIGNVGGNITASVGNRTGLGGQHHQVTTLRIGLALSVAVLAAFGALRRRRRQVHDTVALSLLTAPLVALGLQSYGGEIALRVFLFTLPGAAVLVAYAFFPELASRAATAGRYLLAGVAMLAFVGAFLVARYGNEAYERTDPDAMAAVEDVYRHEGAVRVVGLADDVPASHSPPFLPVGYRDIERTSYASILAPRNPADLTGMIARLRELGPGSYLVTADQNNLYLTIRSGYPADWGERLARRLAAAPEFRMIKHHGRAAVYVLRQTESAGPAGTPAPKPTGFSLVSTPWTPIGVLCLGALAGILLWRELRVLRGNPVRDRGVSLLVAVLSVGFVLVIIERLVLLA